MFEKDVEESLWRKVGIQRREDGQLDLSRFGVIDVMGRISLPLPLGDEGVHDFYLMAGYPGWNKRKESTDGQADGE